MEQSLEVDVYDQCPILLLTLSQRNLVVSAHATIVTCLAIAPPQCSCPLLERPVELRSLQAPFVEFLSDYALSEVPSQTLHHRPCDTESGGGAVVVETLH